MTDGSKEEDRLFVRDGFRHYRRRYSLTEVRWGLATGGALLAIALWVAWKGRHPAPDLVGDPARLLEGAGAATSAPSPTPAPAPPSAASAVAAERGPLPKGLARDGFREEKVAQFDADNLYVKINGRADYFKSFGFRRLYSLLLVSDKEPERTIDVEMYDHGSAANALGAYGGERGPSIQPTVTASGMHHFDRNALYLARGRHYVRVIGSDEEPATIAELRAIAATFEREVEGEALPWAYGFFIGRLGLDPGQIAYAAENAFSLGFARDVWTARPGGKESDLELFVAAHADDKGARAFADRLRRAFLELGQAAGKADGVPLVKDQFLGLFSAAAPIERWVVGVRGAADKAKASAELARLREAIAKAPAELKAQARPSTPAEAGPAPASAPPTEAEASGGTTGGSSDEH